MEDLEWAGAVCSNEKPDTVKMDAAVPGMGGSQACSSWDHDESCFESLKRYARATGMGGLKGLTFGASSS